jgi:hypothetical protein
MSQMIMSSYKIREQCNFFEVVGAGNSDEPTLENLNSISNLYNSNEDKKYLYVKIPNGPFNEDDFIQGIENEPIYFNFMLNMADDKYDFVSGYFKISQPDEVLIKDLGDFKVLLIPMKFHKIDGLIGGNKDVNPISKAGWYYGRQNLNRISYSNTGEFETDNVLVAMKEMVGSIGEIINIFSGPNRALRHKERSKKFISNKSWIRLLNPNHNKFGGGVRVKRLQMHDNWDVMIDKNNPEAIYKQFLWDKNTIIKIWMELQVE